jgi:magnesium transporter
VSSGEPAATPTEALRVPCLVNPKVTAAAAHLKAKGFFWIDLESPSDEDLAEFGKLLDLHPLTIEDARTFHQRPKIEEYQGYMDMVVFGVDTDVSAGERLLREVHMIVSGDYVMTIHRTHLPALDDLRARYADKPLRSEQFLVYKILDAISSTFFPVLARIDDDIDDIEQDVIDRASVESLQRIFGLKRDLVSMRRVITPMRDVFARDADRIAELPGMEADERLYFRDLYDGLIRISDLVDSYRDLLSGATDMYLSTVANRQGEINKQLTVIATIFLPLTFLTGFFGQNFAFLTGHITNHLWAFLVFGIGLLIASVAGFAIYFRRKKWV